MSMTAFYLWVALMLGIALLIILFPLLRGKSAMEKDALTNAQLVKGRLLEIDREVDEGVLSEADKLSAQKEIKLGLVEEQSESGKASTAGWLSLGLATSIALALGIWVYVTANHLQGVQDSALAPENLQELSAKLLDPQAAAAIQPDDIQQLALAIRLRLQAEPEDAQGWMFLGRLRTSLGQLEEAIAAYERSLLLRPDNNATRVSYAQALMMTGEEQSLRKSQRELSALIDISPHNDNLALMMAVTSAQLGDFELASTNYAKIKDKLEPNNPMRVSLETRLAELSGEAAPELTDNEPAELTISITVELAQEFQLAAQQNPYLVIFARQGGAQQGMPVAVKRHTATEFPTTITLGDSDAMIPGLKLSMFEHVNLTARLSSTPEVVPQAGDVEGHLEILDGLTNMAEYRIEINKEIQ